MLNLVRGLTWSCNMDRIETINNTIMYNQSYCLKRVEYISNSSSILPPQLRMVEIPLYKGTSTIIRLWALRRLDGSSDALLVVFNVSAVQLLHVICCNFNKSFQSFGESLFVLTS